MWWHLAAVVRTARANGDLTPRRWLALTTFVPVTIEPRGTSEVPAKMGGAALGLLFGLMLGGPLGGVIGGPLGATVAASVGPVLTPVMEAWVKNAQEEWQRRGNELATGAADASHLDEVKVVERILTSNDLQPLVMRVLDAAARTNSTRKLRALGAVLGEAVSSRPRRVDEDLFIVAALDDLEPAHLRVLEALEGQADPADSDVGWMSDDLAHAVADLSPVGRHAALGGLMRHGLVDTVSGYGEMTYRITEFGHAMLEVMRLPDSTRRA